MDLQNMFIFLNRRVFDADQKAKKASIMQKILMEEDNLKKRRKQQPYLWDDADREKSLVSYTCTTTMFTYQMKRQAKRDSL